MISIFTMPKAFTGEFKTIQLNAIRTWKEECPNSEILLAANETGVSEFADKYRVRHIHDVCENELGSPMLDSLFQRAEEEAHGDIMAYINTDCILVGDLEKAVSLVQSRFEKFLMVGIRYDSDISQSLPAQNWKEFILGNKGLLHHFASRKKRRLTSTGATDIFVFPKNLYSEIPPFSIGAYFWDGWLIYDIWRRQIPIINITSDIIIIHQKHTVKIQTTKIQRKVEINRELCLGKKAVRNADFVLKNGAIQRDKGLSLFTHPRNFRGEFDRIQKNAIRSWLTSCPNSEIVLLGKASGNEKMVQESSRIWQNPEEIAANRNGTTRIKFIFKQGENSAIHGVLGYINTDLILIGDLEKLAVIAREQFREFLIAGRKWNLEIPYEIDFMTNWQNKLKIELENKGSLFSSSHVDYFIFTFQALSSGRAPAFPDFLLGRPYWENWPISYAIANNIPVIDATNVIIAIHSPHTRNIDVVSSGQYTLGQIINQNLIKNSISLKNIDESQFIFTKDSKIIKRGEES